MGQRLLGGAVALALLAAVFWIDRASGRAPWISAAIVALLGTAAAFELHRILAAKLPVRTVAGTAAAGAFLCGKALLLASGNAFAGMDVIALLAVLFALAFAEVVAGDAARSAPRLMAGAFAFLCTVSFSFLLDLLLVPAPPSGVSFALLVVLTAKANDIGGYVVGRLAGGPKLAPRVSPGKTWSGAIGGLVLAVAFAVACGRALDAGLDVPFLLSFAAVVSVASVTGDLAESLIKRFAGAGDSSHLVPTFGGALDLIDSLILSVAAGFHLLLLRGVIGGAV